MLLHRLLLAALLAGFVSASHSAVFAEDWPQWQGPRRTGEWTETGVIERFAPGGPKFRWRAKVAGGYSGPSIADGRVFVSDYVRTQGDAAPSPDRRNVLQGEERLQCFDLRTGERLWDYAYPQRYEISYPAGPRATPTVDGDRVYMLGAEGRLTCLDVRDGTEVWNIDFKRKYNAATPIWGFCAHPLIVGDRLYVTAGGDGTTALCLNKTNGEEIWRSLTAKDAGYCPPTMIETSGRRELLIWTPESLNGLNPEDGAVHWSVPLEPNYGMSIVAPVQSGDRVFAGGIVNVGVMLDLRAEAPPEVLWKSTPTVGLGPVHSPVLVVGEHLYGVDREGELMCLEAATGRRLWQTYAATTGDRRAGSATAFLTRNGDRFYIFNEQGDLIIARLTPEKYEELSRAHVLKPTHDAFGRTVVWSAPAFANRCLFVRNDEEVVCVDLAAP
ncbi:MAG: PQQ-like beta-propeller repeat protein [Planctomyces sp.]|nr:PQQ-like beta-propeller repeat protein [Planctomyces sp.]